MTDIEIIKALWCCAARVDKCTACPLYNEFCNGGNALHKYALDLIDRQQTEIERLRKQRR